ncbi:hypothetical protein [Arenibacter sp. F20364]|uniref:hypothetical protein n=1 Tax=Arenibacter sp. F20364 TaxID=2926415 RepID=UPI001FF54465|nr:hypothetical protein [Arenibacter sp. F20364]
MVLPLVLIFVSEYFRFTSPALGLYLKLFAALLMVLISILFRKFDKNLVFFSTLFLPFLILHFFLSFNYNAATEELIRYLFPIIVLFYGYAIKENYKFLFKFLLVFLILNYIAQIFNYYFWSQGINQWFYVYTSTGRVNIPAVAGILRATGLMGFFSTFGFFNLIMYFLIDFFYEGKFKKTLMVLTVVFLFLSLSFKGIGTFLFLLFLFSNKKIKIIGIALFVSFVTFVFFPSKVAFMADNAKIRIEAYISEGNSARSESYRVMFQNTDFLFGEGLGSFGGPASTKYKSPYYDEVNFNWYGLPNLPTTDTFYPHLFIEIGFIGTLLYLFLFLVPLLRAKKLSVVYFKAILIIYFALFVDALFTYSLNNLVYLSVSLLLIPAILHYEKENKGPVSSQYSPSR